MMKAELHRIMKSLVPSGKEPGIILLRDMKV
jgi:hypothetical protein